MQGFPDAFQNDLHRLMQWRRDVRRFRADPVDPEILDQCLDTFALAPSVGLSEPWRIVKIESASARAAALANFEQANQQALQGYSGEQAERYSTLKLSGMREAPVQWAIYCDDATDKGAGLGAGTMPEMRRYSVVGAINLMWLSARARGLGMGWVSILDADALNRDLAVPKDWSLVAYLCLGWPEDVSLKPELETKGWAQRAKTLHIESR